MAGDRVKWSSGFKTVDYVPVGIADNRGRFILWREVPVVSEAGVAPGDSR